MKNVIGKNRRSPVNEDAYIAEYLKHNPSARRNDQLDISAVIAKNGTRGHGLLPKDLNRSHDRNNHIVKDFIPDKDLKVK